MRLHTRDVFTYIHACTHLNTHVDLHKHLYTNTRTDTHLAIDVCPTAKCSLCCDTEEQIQQLMEKIY